MAINLRDYQQEAHGAAMDWLRKSIEPCLIEAATGAGKSLIIAAIAHDLHKVSGKNILCIAPSAELVEQNHQKYLMTGEKSSLFSAALGMKCLKNPVVFGTPQTIKNKISRFGNRFCAVVVDEAHGITPTIKFIIDRLRESNPNLRVLGLTATPSRLGEGYIYKLDENDRPTGAEDAYFSKKVYTVEARTLIDRGYLTRPVVGAINSGHYDTLDIDLKDKAQIDRAYHGHGRKTAAIIADVIAQARDRKGVMIFAATVQHAQECMASLPPELSAIVTGKTNKLERASILRRFKSGQLKYLVNVAVLTTGFDAPHVDLIALLRATESVTLLQQIIGRGLRVCDGKEDCLILDYAQNIERHCPDGDLFSPVVKQRKAKDGEGIIEATCELCNTINTFSARPNPDLFSVDVNGYFIDLLGNRVAGDHGPIPAHFGRRCQGMRLVTGGVLEQCQHRWTSKECPHCKADNDIAARYCCECNGEIIDPNEKLVMEYQAMMSDPYSIRCEEVLSVEARPSISQKGNECLKVSFTTPHNSFTVWFSHKMRRHKMFIEYLMNKEPSTVTYRKDPESKLHSVLAFDQDTDQQRLADALSRVA